MPLERFKQAQDESSADFDTALTELRAGRKTSHWIWYVFPQLAGLGHSATAQHYALKNLAEACDYLRDPLLRDRLLLATEAVAQKLTQGVQVADLMGGTTDSLKLVSSLTLFHLATEKLNRPVADPAFEKLAALCETVLSLAERQGFPRCNYTLTNIGEKR